MYNEEFFNYEICSKEQSSGRYYFIDDGPYFRSLVHLIEHYSKYEDGLPGILTRPISPSVDIMRCSFGNNTKFPNGPLIRQTSNLSSSSLQNPQIQDLITQKLMQTSITSANSNFKCDTLSKTNLFKSRTLLNDNSR